MKRSFIKIWKNGSRKEDIFKLWNQLMDINEELRCTAIDKDAIHDSA